MSGEKRLSNDSEMSQSPMQPRALGSSMGDDSSVTSDGVHRIYTAGDNDEYICIGRQKFLRDDLIQAFGGTLNPGLAPPSEHRFANPAPLGLSGFALTTFVLALFKTQAQGITIPNVVVGPALFYGGLVQLIAGVWELALENTFGGTALCSYGGFWMSFSALYIPWFGVVDAYKDDPSQLGNAVGIYLLGWAIFTFGLSICTVKSTLMFFLLYFLLGVTFLLLAIGSFIDNFGVNRAGGVFGVIVAFIAWYNALAGLANKRNSYVVCRAVPLPNNEWHI
ncbi:probable Ammonia transport outward protein 2 [Zygosaccharomyces bailii]|nr:probable Ammonia transport outward protein 2 [Zygosaccharomyces bailii]